MSDAMLQRLSKIISTSSNNSGPDGNDGLRPRRIKLEIHLSLAEGWLSLFLLAAVLYSTIWSIQAAGWVSHMEILSLTTAVGLILGIIAAKQQRLSRGLVYSVTIMLGLLLVIWQVAEVFFQGNILSLLQDGQRWVFVVSAGGFGSDDAIFLFLIAYLGFLLAVVSAWLVYSLRNPWLMVVMNAVALLVSLNNMGDGASLFFLALFLIAALILLLRFSLHESITRWHRLGLRYADGLGWDVMQTGAVISLVILVLAWVLPSWYVDPVAAQIWTTNANPLVQIQNTWGGAFGASGSTSLPNHGNFRDALALGGNPNLNNDIVLTMSTDDTALKAQYLAFVSYADYKNGAWSIGSTSTGPVDANTDLPTSASLTHVVKQTVTMINSPGEQNAYILGSSEITKMSLPATIYFNSGGIVAWVGKNGDVAVGTPYSVTSAVSTADIGTLQTIALPQNAPAYNPNINVANEAIPVTAYDSNLLHAYAQQPQGADGKRIGNLAQQIVKAAHASSMYDQASALETYLRSNYRYDVNIHPQPGEDPVAWFLFDGNKAGFCNYFASAMALMARSLGMPARVISGYAGSTWDAQKKQYVMHGKDAHTWTQIYFAGYGWINFEPSAGFSSFERPLGSQQTSGQANNTSATNAAGHVVPPSLRGKLLKDGGGASGGSGDSSAASARMQALQRQRLLAGSGGLVLVLLLLGGVACAVWWRRLFAQYSLPTRLYGRISVLARLAGNQISPAQTPYEYAQGLASSALLTEDDVKALERLADIYVRERWADPQSDEYPDQNGESEELAEIWKRLRSKFFAYALSHPYFLLWWPRRAWKVINVKWQGYSQRKIAKRGY